MRPFSRAEWRPRWAPCRPMGRAAAPPRRRAACTALPPYVHVYIAPAAPPLPHVHVRHGRTDTRGRARALA